MLAEREKADRGGGFDTYVPMRTVYVRPAPGKEIVGICLAFDVLDGAEPNSPDEAMIILEKLREAYDNELAEEDGFVFDASKEAAELENGVQVDGTLIEWTVVDPAVEPMILKVERTITYEVTSVYVVRMTRAEYEEAVEDNGGTEFDALEKLVLTSHRDSPVERDPRVTFVSEREEQVDDGYYTETEVISEADVPEPEEPMYPLLVDATDAELAAEILRRREFRAGAAAAGPTELSMPLRLTLEAIEAGDRDMAEKMLLRAEAAGGSGLLTEAEMNRASAAFFAKFEPGGPPAAGGPPRPPEGFLQ